MKVLLVHPSGLMYSEVYLRLEPLGLECVAEAVRRAGHHVRLLDLQIFKHRDLFREIESFAPDAIGFSLNYLANVPEVLDLAKQVKAARPGVFVFAGGHSVSFIAPEVLEHSEGAIDAIVTGEGERSVPVMLEAAPQVHGLPGVTTVEGSGPRAELLENLDEIRPARDLTRSRRKYFIGQLDPCASIEFTRGCPWDCSFCSAWTFYGRSYRKADPHVIGAEMQSIREPNLFIVDDVAFVRPEHGMAIADEVERRGIRKQFYLETRCDTLIRNEEVFARWARLGLRYMFLGFESLDADQLKMFRKRVTPNQNFKALDVARRLGIRVAINLITDPSWTVDQFRQAREWATQVPEIVHLTVATPYPGTELFHTETRRLTSADYRLFDVQHAVLPTTLPLAEFYEQLVQTQSIINRKFMGWKTAFALGGIIGGQLLRGQTNFLKMLFKFSKVYNPRRQYGDHLKPVKYPMRRPEEYGRKPEVVDLMVHHQPVTARTEAAATETAVAVGVDRGG